MESKRSRKTIKSKKKYQANFVGNKYVFAKLLFAFSIIFLVNSSNADGLFDIITDNIPSVDLISKESLFPSSTIKHLMPKDTQTTKINKDIPRIPSYNTVKIMPNINLWSYLNPDFLHTSIFTFPDGPFSPSRHQKSVAGASIWHSLIIRGLMFLRGM